MDETTNTWDHSILTDIFLPEDVGHISSIPISPGYQDSWYWYGDPRGCYTVKSGYRALVGEQEHILTHFDMWIPLWKLKVPPKWKTFLWRAINDILPVTTNLLIKRVEVDPSCPKCGGAHEDVMHALVLCDFSQLVWNDSTLPLSSVMGDIFDMWFTNVMIALPEDKLDLVVAVLYSIWRARNTAVWDCYLPTPKKVLRQAGSSLRTWRAVHGSRQATVPQPLPVTQPTGMEDHPQQRRCFVDAGYQSSTRVVSFGVVLFAPSGEFLAACAGPLQGCSSPLMAETAACSEALAWLRRKGVSHVQLFTDCSQLRSGLSSP
ncbi:uncharacterized protein LOC116023467 [Ipomoea triloba]|uniref:uncharacterized protein LOC116023467 n=1 Tax=Ipomoea triloba TaxID=35885 RepID=UPI00125E84C0|nr:uncharacterized protein LOC116023467 [Ipomoea triloba]